jgi:GNAT superfamily N-acetyltransferase
MTFSRATTPPVIVGVADQTDVAMLSAAFGGPPYKKSALLFARYLEEMREGTRRFFCARVEELRVGYVSVLWHSTYPPFRAAGIPEINDLHVLAPWRQRGVGTALLRAADECTWAAGFEAVGIGVGMNADAAAARRLYPSLGYLTDEASAAADPRPWAAYFTKRRPTGESHHVAIPTSTPSPE